MVIDQCQKCGSSLQQRDTGTFCSACLLRAVIEFEPGPPEDELPKIDGYEIIEEIGRGGVGRVYRARQQEPNREVALKLVLDTQMAGEDARARFLQEIEYAATLEHPSITPIYEAGRQEGFLFFSTRLMQGGDLGQSLESWTPDPQLSPREIKRRQQEIALLVESLAVALHYAHQRGVIHQDIKTSNILLDQNGTPFIGDFGLASQVEPQPATFKKNKGSLSGSPSYMAPEQLDQTNQSVAIDLYSLGIVLFELLTGSPPFKSDSLPVVFQMIRNQKVEFHKEHQHLDESLQAICLKCLEKDPKQRYSSGQALADDLRAFLELRPVKARPVRPLGKIALWCKRRPALATMAALLILSLAWIVCDFVNQTRANELARITAEKEEEESRLRLIEQLFDKADTAGRQKNYQIAVDNLLEAAALCRASSDKREQALDLLACWAPALPDLIHHPGGLKTFLCVSTDGQYMATWSFGPQFTLWKLDSPLKMERTWTNPSGDVVDVSFSPDQQRLLVSTDKETRVLDINSFETIKVLPLNKSSVSAQPFNYPRGKSKYSADGRLLTVALQGDDVTVWDARSFSKLHQFAIPAALSGEFQDTLEILYRKHEVIVAWRGGFLVGNQEDGSSRFFPAGKRMDTIKLSPSGRFLATGDIDKSIRLFRTDSYELVGKGTHLSRVSDLAFSHDEKSLLTVSRDRSARIWEINKSGTLTLKKNLNHPKAVTATHWFPNENVFATYAEDGIIRYFSAPTGRLVTTQNIPGGRLRTWQFHHNSGNLWIGGDNGHVSRLDIPVPPPLFARSPQQIRTVACASDGSDWAGVCDLDKGRQSLSSWNGQSLSQHVSTGQSSTRYSMSLTREGHFAACGSQNGVSIWDTRSGKRMQELKTPGEEITRTAIVKQQDDFLVAAFSSAEELILTRTTSPSDSTRYAITDAVQCLGFSPDGSLLALGYPSGQIFLLQTDQPSAPPRQLAKKHSNQVTVIEFSPSGKLLASGGMDGRVWLHEVGTGQPVSPPMLHDDYVWTLSFSDDEQILATGGQEYLVRMFDVSSGRQLGPPRIQSAWINGLVFREDHFLACGSDCSIRTVSLPPKNDCSLSEWREIIERKLDTKQSSPPPPVLRLKE